MVTGALRQSVHALVRLYPQQNGPRAETDVERILRAYMASFPTDEYTLLFLLGRLIEQKRMQEAHSWFKRTRRAFTEEGSRLDARTIEVGTSLQQR
jgi:hypothetical protein